MFYLEQCQSDSNEKHACKWDTPEDQQVSNEATQMCEHLLKDEKFEKCRKVNYTLNKSLLNRSVTQGWPNLLINGNFLVNGR